jgi:choline dehydrogenase
MAEADFIIVGAGSAGAALAWGLAADEGVKVLVVEAGGPATSWRYRMPAALAYVLARPEGLWTYATDPEPGLGGRVITHPRGRVLGGTSAINGMMFVRGNKADYDGWAAMGATGWDHAAVLPVFRAMEARREGADAFRGGGGPLSVQRGAGENALDQAFLAAAEAAGLPATPDFNAASQEGAGHFDQTIRNGTRETAATAFLSPRPNLRVLSGQTVLGLAFDGARCTGIRLATGTLRAAREVILSAGAFGTPHLLLLSGIGPADDLLRHGLPVVADLPGVGANLQDHPDLTLRWTCRTPTSLHPLTRPMRKALSGLQWFASRKGPAATSHFEVGAFLRSSTAEAQPDLQLSFLPLALAPGAVQSDTSIGRHGFQVHVDLVKPRSRGALRLASPDPAVPPRMSFGYLTDPSDAARLSLAIDIVRDIVAQGALARHAEAEIDPAPGGDRSGWLQARTDTAYHPVGTCRMGAPDDPLAVTDPEGRVQGVAGLRVADASLIPDIPGGNTNAAAMMIGLKIAQAITGRLPKEPA